MLKYILSSGLLLSVVGLSYTVEQHEFNWILTFYAIGFLSYLGLIRDKNISIKEIAIFAIGLRFILLFNFPNLSDDVYRFYWDGLVSNGGFNPYFYLPKEAMDFGIAGLSESLFSNLNSPNYYTIYPPLNQAVFYVGAWIFPNSIHGAAFVYSLFLFISEVAVIVALVKLLDYYGINRKRLVLYALNPLVIIEVMANLHFESMMLALLLWTILFMTKFKSITISLFYSSLFYAGSIATKLHTLLFFPYLFILQQKRKKWTFTAFLSLILLILFIPLLYGLGMGGFGSSLDLYFQKFEFNAGIYYILRYIGYEIIGYNAIGVIGPALAIMSVCLMILLFLKACRSNIELKNRRYFSFLLFSFVVFLFFSTTVHPWYLIIPLGLATFTSYRFIYLWSFLICLTYINYSFGNYNENLIVVGVEYLMVFSFMFYELITKKIIEELKN